MTPCYCHGPDSPHELGSESCEESEPDVEPIDWYNKEDLEGIEEEA